MADKFLRVATVHMDVEHGNPRKNLDLLVWLCRSAAAMGARLVCAPEMCLSGYVFKSPRAIAAMAETIGGRALETLGTVASECQVFLVAGLAEKDARTGMLYNSAFALGPNGKLVGQYRKVNAEPAWAAPGPPAQDNVFLTPWGGVGLLVCSDSYHALMPRVTALKGASLVLLPTCWPGSDDGFPQSLFRLRALENGVWLLAANRGGAEEGIDLARSRSSLSDPWGQISKGTPSGVDARVRSYDLPLEGERLADRRGEILVARRPEHYGRVYGDLGKIKNLTSFLGLPAPGFLDVQALAPGRANPVDFLERVIDNFRPDSLVLLPQSSYSEAAAKRLGQLAKRAQVGVVWARTGQGGQFMASRLLGAPLKTGFGPWPIHDFGPARLMLADQESLWHPELAIAAAKEGVDLVLCPGAGFSREDQLMLGLRPIEQVAVAAASPQAALVSLIPEGHGPGRGASAQAGQVAAYTVDTSLTRRKRFQDRVDFESLFLPPILDYPPQPWQD
ncbi:MAG: carbon-nitrogen hydrolase family protein [Deltaproteobacteria bacterium]|nr:carbon-nitrogen hydrolase family protein [Deltaproteobacteria bacterium]